MPLRVSLHHWADMGEVNSVKSVIFLAKRRDSLHVHIRAPSHAIVVNVLLAKC
ncbi:hypothetical protein CsSME_00028685 [Camellia sinensis var. sinensis]